ncbi:hypothetical protein RHO14_03215 [Orbus wheelerorum]|uniref:hypothetical protein n=1 Tax=Orbus wheelerorum TaxID=3074111 RepID=UPI00370D622A
MHNKKMRLSDIKLFHHFKHDGRILQLIDNDYLEQWAVGYDQKTGEVINLNLYINVEPINVDIIEINNR